MSRSYRRPFASVCGKVSAKQDKQMAHRGVRRVQNRIARLMAENPDLLMPHFRSCPWNNPYSWSRDGESARNGQMPVTGAITCWQSWVCGKATHRNEYYLAGLPSIMLR